MMMMMILLRLLYYYYYYSTIVTTFSDLQYDSTISLRFHVFVRRFFVSIPFCSVPFCSVLFCSTLLLLYSILFYFIRFYSIVFAVNDRMRLLIKRSHCLDKHKCFGQKNFHKMLRELKANHDLSITMAALETNYHSLL
jgi:hypothetical protein